ASVALHAVRGDAALHELAVGRLDAAEQAVAALQERARVHVARRREHAPDAPLDAVVEGRMVVAPVHQTVKRVLLRRSVEALEARAARVTERRAEVVEEQLELGDPAGPRERERREEPA